MEYNEKQIVTELARVDQKRQTAFAASCAERLMPLFAKYTSVTGDGDPEGLRGVLDHVWNAVRGDDEGFELAADRDVAESMVPSDEDDWVFEMGYGQNAAAAVVYAIRTWMSGDAQEAAWAARQVYEAADLAAQQSLPALTNLNDSEVARQLLESQAVQAALRGISSDLSAVQSESDDRWAGLQRRARDEGAEWAGQLP